jgi:transposase
VPTEEQRALDLLLTRRRQLVEMRVMESHRLKACRDAKVAAGIRSHVEWLDARIDEADKELAEAVRKSPVWRERDELLQSVPGVGTQTSLTLIASMPELGTVDSGQVAALAGLAPFNDDSGKHKGARHIAGGRADVRRALYMAALSAVRYNQVFKAFSDRLEKLGKKAKVILTAVARRLLVVANAMVRTGQPWRPELAAARPAKT